MVYLGGSPLLVFVKEESQLDTARPLANFGRHAITVLVKIASCVFNME